MNVEYALEWVEKHCTEEECIKLRSHRVAKTLADEVGRLTTELKSYRDGTGGPMWAARYAAQGSGQGPIK